jgi:hypothetical protein
VRACGEALDAAGNVTARAWCEAFVQRAPAYVAPTEGPEIEADSLSNIVNKKFGRRFDLVSFRWLAPSEISTPSNS